MAEITLRPNKFIRSTILKLRPTPEQIAKLDHTTRLIHARARAWSDHLLELKHSRLDANEPANQQEQADLYTAIMADALPRGYLSYLRNHEMRSSIAKGPGYDLARTLRAAGQLPFTFPRFDRDNDHPPTALDYAAFEMAVSGLKSWEECDQRTRTQYADLQAKLAAHELTQDEIADLDAYETALGHPVTPKQVDDFHRWGFDARRWTEALQPAREINDDQDYWNKLFRYSLCRDKLKWAHPTAALTLPDPEIRNRPHRLGTNYIGFRLIQHGRHLTLRTRLLGPDTGAELIWEDIPIMPTGYWRQLHVIEQGTSYLLKYRRGNASKLEEDVEMTLNELILQTRNGQHYVRFPMNGTATPDEAAFAEHGQYMKLQSVNPSSPILAADLGLSRFWSWRVYNEGESVKCSSIGDPRHGSLAGTIHRLREDIKAVRHLIAYRKDYEAGRAPHQRFQPLLDKSMERLGVELPLTHELLRQAVSRCLFRAGEEVRELRRYDLHKQRQTDLCHEHLDFIWLIKDYVRVLKSWRFYGMTSAQPGEVRPGFERWSRYITNLRVDLIKKAAQQLIQRAREYDCKTVVIEDLGFERRAELDRRFNDLIQLWSPRSILNWVNHFAQQYGIVVVMVDPAHTSQLDPETGDWAYRDKFDRKWLLVRRNGRIVWIDADKDAACANIYGRYIDRVGSTVTIKVVKYRVGERDVFKVAPAAGKIQDAYLTRRYGSKSPVFVAEGDRVVLAPGGKKVSIPRDCKGSPELLYRHGDAWVTKSVRYELQNAIRSDGVAQRAREEAGRIALEQEELELAG